MIGAYWEVEEHAALTAGIRAHLLAVYGYTAPAEHTHAALISVRDTRPAIVTCLVTFPFTFVASGALAGDLEALIDAECRTRLLALRNAAPLTSIVSRRHPL